MNNLQVMEFNNQRILTTNQLAEIYGTEMKRITNNFNYHKQNFKEGVHYYKLTGEELKTFKNHTRNSGVVPKRTGHLYLWTEQGASRHCKILETEQAWKHFDLLERTYFQTKQDENESQSLPSTDVSQEWTISLVTNVVTGVLNGVDKRFIETEKEVVQIKQELIETKDIITEQQINNAKVINEMRDMYMDTANRVTLKAAGVKVLAKRLREKLSELTGEKICTKHWLYDRATYKLLSSFGVTKWEDIPQHMSNKVFAAIDSLECATYLSF